MERRPGSHRGGWRSAALAPHERERALRCCRWSPQRRWRRRLRVGSFERPTADRRQLGHGGRLRPAPPSAHAAPRAAGVPAPTWFAGPLVLHSPPWLTRAARVDGGGVGCNGGSGGSGGPGAVGTRAHHASRRRREPQSQPVYTCVMITSSVRATISSSKLPTGYLQFQLADCPFGSDCTVHVDCGPRVPRSHALPDVALPRPSQLRLLLPF